MRGSRRRFSQLKVCRRKITALLRASMARSKPLDRLVDTTEGDEGTYEIEMEREFRAGPLQLLELGEVAQGLLRRPARASRYAPVPRPPTPPGVSAR